jgi:hypothetical protein
VKQKSSGRQSSLVAQPTSRLQRFWHSAAARRKSGPVSAPSRTPLWHDARLPTSDDREACSSGGSTARARGRASSKTGRRFTPAPELERARFSFDRPAAAAAPHFSPSLPASPHFPPQRPASAQRLRVPRPVRSSSHPASLSGSARPASPCRLCRASPARPYAHAARPCRRAKPRRLPPLPSSTRGPCPPLARLIARSRRRSPLPLNSCCSAAWSPRLRRAAAPPPRPVAQLTALSGAVRMLLGQFCCCGLLLLLLCCGGGGGLLLRPLLRPPAGSSCWCYCCSCSAAAGAAAAARRVLHCGCARGQRTPGWRARGAWKGPTICGCLSASTPPRRGRALAPRSAAEAAAGCGGCARARCGRACSACVRSRRRGRAFVAG